MQEIIENCVQHIVKEEDKLVGIIWLTIYMKGQNNKIDEMGSNKQKNVQTENGCMHLIEFQVVLPNPNNVNY
jgi:hypothetical protein